ncbi:MAG: transglycosylase SLT domain-containing protein [Candidatus Competibacteraceae bacterium]|nr:transglycosylase SLT domain-containing protein [Candidatus Competibacteraceae bacterium]
MESQSITPTLSRVAPSPDVIIAIRDKKPLRTSSKQPSNSNKLKESQPTQAAKQPPPPSKSLSDGLWQRIRKRLVLTGQAHARIDEQTAYLKRNPGFFKLMAQRAKPFLLYLLQEIERRKLPADLVLLPMIESAFDPVAVSPKGAAGLWQIMPATGEQYGLQLIEGYDGRYDIHAATEAALDYLSYLHKYFKGDWLLALAAYNAGEGRVQRAMQANLAAGQDTDYWSLNLPKETQAYVPKMLALSRIVFNPRHYSIKLPKIGTQPYLARIAVELEGETLLEEVLVAADLEVEEFFRFNPALQPATPVPERSYDFLLPLEKAEALVNQLPGAKWIAIQKHTVKRGDTLSTIAKRYGVSYRKLARWNGLSIKSIIKPGQELLVYPDSQG